ncbi:Swi5, putative [Leishmania lindenbergi]|uniref:Swi5 n=1 Tax=Leishmania lindenbergi TaxID=651832 RepID=A0AAW2ZTY3_9TRYP
MPVEEEIATPYQLLCWELSTLPFTELFHRYNAAKDLGQELIGLVAQHENCTIAHAYRMLGVQTEAATRDDGGTG